MNGLIAYPNNFDGAVLSGGSWTAGLPLSNLLTTTLAQVARTVNAAAASSVVDINLNKARAIKVICIINHNMLATTSPSYRIRAYSDAGMTSVIYDSGVQPVWTRMFPSLTLNFEDANFWDGTPTNEDLVGYRWNISHLLPTKTIAQYWKIELIDTTNAAGYLQLGRIFMSGEWSPTKNFSYGASLRYESNTKTERSVGESKFFDVRPSYRVASFSLDNMTIDEGYSKALDLGRIVGLDKEVFYMYDQADTVHKLRRSFVGTLRKLPAVAQIAFAVTKAEFEIEESL